jgi:lipoprotein-releasing system permease protein
MPKLSNMAAPQGAPIDLPLQQALMPFSNPFEFRIGWRHVRTSRGGRRNRFISFISAVSITGIALGVAALIIVLSVMNGFQKEVRDRMLSVLSHLEVVSLDGSALSDVPELTARLRRHPEVLAAAPFVASQALLARGEDMRGVIVRGIEPASEARVSDLVGQWSNTLRERLQPGQFGVILGQELARTLGVRSGDAVTLIAPSGQVTPAGVMPRLRQLEVLAVFDSGHYEYDSTLALMHLQDAQKMFKTGGPLGLRVKVRDAQQAPRIAQELALDMGAGIRVRDWTQQNKTWFTAVQIEKRMMFIILTLIVAVAAFNLVTTLVMTVTEKRADIAILRTLGATPASILLIFVIQGALSGLAGTVAGTLLGLGVALNLDTLVPAIEQGLGVRFLPQDIYLISHMPSDPQVGDIVPVVLLALWLSLLATLYPSWRASRVDPVEALRHE